jgi:prepilin-type N-terminal cleavage/methylation domain-containing protein
MTRQRPGRRAGFTLVELLVAMAVMATLAAIAIAVVPSAVEQDRTTDAAATIRQHLTIAKARATRENNGRGIRFILDSGSNDPARMSGVDTAGFVYGALFSSELQYIEAAPTIVPNPLGLTGPTDAYVEFDPTTGTTTLVNLDPNSEAILVMQNDLAARWFPKLYCPVLGPDAFGRSQRFEVINLQRQGTTNNWTVTLDRQPHSLLGAGTTQRVYRFAVEPRSRALLGEPNVPLPKNVCVDLNAGVSLPSARVVNGQPIDFEIMFAPNGQVVDPLSSGLIYLWVRDYTKTDPTTGKPLDMRPATTTPHSYVSQFQFEIGGEQQLVAIKAKSGAIGTFPVNWPNATGIYAAGFGPYSLAAKDSNSP